MTSANKPKRIALCLILFFTALGVTLTDATTENNYKNDTTLLPRISETTLTENGYKANIIINPYTTGIYAEESDFNLDLTINPQGIGGVYTENNYQLDLTPEKTFPNIPDLAVTNVTLSKTIVGQGYTISIETTVKNRGFYFENFNVIAYANTTIIQTQTMTLTSGNSTTITFTWNTTGFAYGNYTISAVTDIVPGETFTADNNYFDDIVLVTIPGNMDGDGDVDSYDFYLFSGKYGSSIGDPTYIPEADIDGDGDVDSMDFYIFSGKYGQSIPP